LDQGAQGDFRDLEVRDANQANAERLEDPGALGVAHLLIRGVVVGVVALDGELQVRAVESPNAPHRRPVSAIK
jgi:hypothetical protein